ncbi:MAG TPA: SGNH/GDSL hydrolase family protein [Candidatus Saccharimonadales bacterium]|nr:SGNH/GDSL hydrolase family protein [Candidatus Saccharimonadales bacterium]
MEACSAPVQISGLGKVGKVAMGNLAVFAIGSGAQSTPPTPKPLKYVALGDSYSSGEGAPDPKFINGTDQKSNMCHRSTAAYSNVLFKANSKLISNFTFRACSGATIPDFYKSNVEGNKNEPSQLSWLGPDIDLVSLTIGGNDIGFGDIMAYCATRYHTYKSCESKYDKITNTKIANLGKATVQYSLPNLYSSIKHDAPNADVAVLGYPRLFPTKPPKTCATGIGNLKFSKSDMTWMNSMSAKLDSVIKSSAQRAGFKYIDVQDSLQGHELCTKTPYVNRAILDATNPNILNQINWSFHPKAAGHRIFATILQKQIG